jgi:alpha-1,2-mannosyltransferase
MAYFWQSPRWGALRSGAWLTAARVRGYSLILLGISVIALVGWTLLSDGLIDRNGKPDRD